MNPLLLVDSYKIHHTRMYPEGMTKLYSNFTPRKSRIKSIDRVVVFGPQHFVLKYLIEDFNKNFFGKDKKEVLDEYKRHVNIPDYAHVEQLWDLGYLPIEIKALDEGTLCPIGVPMLTITNTHPYFGWLVNYLETLISCMLWQPITSATIAYKYKQILTKYAKETDEKNIDFINWQGHDFSMRGMSSVESAILSGMGHLTSFTGTDTIPAIYQLESSYDANGLIGDNVPATEHSVMCMGTKESEIETFRRLLNLYPSGILSVVSDTWDLWKVCVEYLPILKDSILDRYDIRIEESSGDLVTGDILSPIITKLDDDYNPMEYSFKNNRTGQIYGEDVTLIKHTKIPGKLVIRPDSGDPVDIICGGVHTVQALTEGVATYIGHDGIVYMTNPKMIDNEKERGYYKCHNLNGNWFFTKSTNASNKQKGVIELLWDIFGGTVNKQGYKVLDPHIGAIYGDSITIDRAVEICERLKAKGFASTNIVLGIGSYTYQYNTRDTFGFAMKATYGEVLMQSDYDLFDQGGPSEGQWFIDKREIFKDPITDDGTKKSKKGLLRVEKPFLIEDQNKGLQVYDQQTWEQEQTGLLTTVFKDGKLVKKTTLEEIRRKLNEASTSQL